MQQQYERQTRYNKANTTTVLLRLNKRTDADIIGRLREVKKGKVEASNLKKAKKAFGRRDNGR